MSYFDRNVQVVVLEFLRTFMNEFKFSASLQNSHVRMKTFIVVVIKRVTNELSYWRELVSPWKKPE